MGEVIEISIVSKDECLLMNFLDFISLQMKDNIIRKIVEVMDNWQYENVEAIDSIESLKSFIGNKIVSITEIRASGQAGISIEPIGDLLLYNVWFNSTCFSIEGEYSKLIDNFIEYLSEYKLICNIIIGAIGKEIKFEYWGNSKETISKAHNVDVWLTDKNDFLNNELEKYKILADICCESINKEVLVLSNLI